MALYGLKWPYMALYGLIWFYGPYIVLYVVFDIPDGSVESLIFS